MELRAVPERPGELALTVPANGSVESALTALDRALVGRRYAERGNVFFRLEGSVTGPNVSLTATPYAIPGVSAGYGILTLQFDGVVEETPAGTRLKGFVSPFTPRWLPWAGSFTLVAAMVWAISVMGPAGVLAIIIIAPVVPMWLWIIRHNRRAAMRNADQLARLLAAIVSNPPSGVAHPRRNS